MDYYDHATLATARLSWAYPGQSTQVVPQWVLYPSLPVNQPPAVNAGVDQTINLPAVASLNGMAQDDGLPSPANLTTAWSKISGREDSDGGTVVFANPNAPVTTATFGADGIYVLRLTVSDGAVTVSDDVTITVNPVPVIGNGNRTPRRVLQRSRTTARISSRSSAAGWIRPSTSTGPRPRRPRACPSTTSRRGGPDRSRRR